MRRDSIPYLDAATLLEGHVVLRKWSEPFGSPLYGYVLPLECHGEGAAAHAIRGYVRERHRRLSGAMAVLDKSGALLQPVLWAALPLIVNVYIGTAFTLFVSAHVLLWCAVRAGQRFAHLARDVEWVYGRAALVVQWLEVNAAPIRGEHLPEKLALLSSADRVRAGLSPQSRADLHDVLAAVVDQGELHAIQDAQQLVDALAQEQAALVREQWTAYRVTQRRRSLDATDRLRAGMTHTMPVIHTGHEAGDSTPHDIVMKEICS